jgi:septum site-determining protein MinC
MSKIAIISQPDQGVLIDVGGCASMQEAVSHLSSTLQVSSQFWKGVNVALNLGDLELTSTQVAHILALAKGVGVYPYQVFAQRAITREALSEHNVNLGVGKPMTLPAMTIKVPENVEIPTEDWEESESGFEDQDVSIFYESSENIFIDEEVPADDIDFAPPEVHAEQSTGAIEGQESPASTQASNALSTATAVAAAPAKVINTVVPATNVMYLRQTLRSGQCVSHKGHLIVIGDVNPGAEVMAEGDITVWGSLRGIAHAGVGGNNDCEIRALRLQPIQIRIGNAFARSPDRSNLVSYTAASCPETARVVDGKIKVFRFSPG